MARHKIPNYGWQARCDNSIGGSKGRQDPFIALMLAFYYPTMSSQGPIRNLIFTIRTQMGGNAPYKGTEK